jgi:hypothetical protein
MKATAASTTTPVTNAAMQEYTKISFRTLAIASPVQHPYSRDRPLQHRGEKVKFLSNWPLNTRKRDASGVEVSNRLNTNAAWPMSALPPKADIERHDWHVRFVS